MRIKQTLLIATLTLTGCSVFHREFAAENKYIKDHNCNLVGTDKPHTKFVNGDVQFVPYVRYYYLCDGIQEYLITDTAVFAKDQLALSKQQTTPAPAPAK
jgi:hypothetical protein